MKVEELIQYGKPLFLCVRIVYASKKLFNPMGEARQENAKKVFRRVQGDANQKDDATSSGNCLKISRDTGVSDVTLYKWRKDYRNLGVAVPGNKKNSECWAAEDKLAVVIETAAFNEIQLSEYCRNKGLYKEQIDKWKIAALSGYT